MSEKEEVKKISDWERKRREHIILEARASVELEGFVLDEEFKAEDQMYINGELSMKELSEMRISALMELAKNVDK